MKISQLKIDGFRHLKDLHFDFTYPLDYKDKTKAGKPLDKICFIGQSATGKTGLLELIKASYTNLMDVQINENNFTTDTIGELGKSETTFSDDVEIFKLSNDTLEFKGEILDYTDSGQFNHLFAQSTAFLCYIKANLISSKNIEIFNMNTLDISEKYNKFFNNNDNFKELNSSVPIIFDDNVDPNLWLFLLTEILDYRKKFTQKMSEFIHKGLLANQEKLNIEFDKWQKENPNPLEPFLHKFNPILQKLNLEVDLVNTEYAIPLLNKFTDEIIPIQNASTGTKGLLLSFLPLFKLDTDKAIILIDEPERSLYPDMQMDLIEHYQHLAPKSQIIVATHSPFIAAAFEPEERFILYFDDAGKVQVRRGKSPIGDDPNDMLKNDFKVNYYNKYGEDAYKKYLKLKQDVANEKNSEKKKALMLKMVKLGDKYNF